VASPPAAVAAEPAVRKVPGMEAISAAETAAVTASIANGRDSVSPTIAPASGRAMKSAMTIWAPMMVPLARSRRSLGTSAGRMAWEVLSKTTSHMPSRNAAT
jgi:hypothetical protein